MADMPQDLVKELARIAGELERHHNHFDYDTEEEARRASEDRQLRLAKELRALAAGVPQDAMLEIARWRKRWGGLRRWLKQQAEVWSRPCLSAQLNHREIHVSAYKSLLHEMDQTRAGNRPQRESDLLVVHRGDLAKVLEQAFVADGDQYGLYRRRLSLTEMDAILEAMVRL